MSDFPVPSIVTWPLHPPASEVNTSIRVQLCVLMAFFCIGILVPIVTISITWIDAYRDDAFKKWFWLCRTVKRVNGTYIVLNVNVIECTYPFVLVPPIMARTVLHYRYLFDDGSPRYLNLFDDLLAIAFTFSSWFGGWAMIQAFVLICDASGAKGLVSHYRPQVGNAICVIVGPILLVTLFILMIRGYVKQARITDLLLELDRLAPTQTALASPIASRLVQSQTYANRLGIAQFALVAAFLLINTVLITACYLVAYQVWTHVQQSRSALASRMTLPQEARAAQVSQALSRPPLAMNEGSDSSMASEKRGKGLENELGSSTNAKPLVVQAFSPSTPRDELPNLTRAVPVVGAISQTGGGAMEGSGRSRSQDALRKTAKDAFVIGMVTSIAMMGMCGAFIYGAVGRSANNPARDRRGQLAHIWVYACTTMILTPMLLLNLIASRERKWTTDGGISSLIGKRRSQSVSA